MTSLMRHIEIGTVWRENGSVPSWSKELRAIGLVGWWGVVLRTPANRNSGELKYHKQRVSGDASGRSGIELQALGKNTITMYLIFITAKGRNTLRRIACRAAVTAPQIHTWRSLQAPNVGCFRHSGTRPICSTIGRKVLNCLTHPRGYISIQAVALYFHHG